MTPRRAPDSLSPRPAGIPAVPWVLPGAGTGAYNGKSGWSGRERPVPTPRAVPRGECLVCSLPPAAPPEPEQASRPPLVPSLSAAIRLAIWLRKGVIFVLGLSVVLVGVVAL